MQRCAPAQFSVKLAWSDYQLVCKRLQTTSGSGSLTAVGLPCVITPSCSKRAEHQLHNPPVEHACWLCSKQMLLRFARGSVSVQINPDERMVEVAHVAAIRRSASVNGAASWNGIRLVLNSDDQSGCWVSSWLLKRKTSSGLASQARRSGRWAQLSTLSTSHPRQHICPARNAMISTLCGCGLMRTNF
jgi:hypothetical protein